MRLRSGLVVGSSADGNENRDGEIDQANTEDEKDSTYASWGTPHSAR